MNISSTRSNRIKEVLQSMPVLESVDSDTESEPEENQIQNAVSEPGEKKSKRQKVINTSLNESVGNLNNHVKIMLPMILQNNSQIQLLTNEVIKQNDLLESNNNLLQTLIQKYSSKEEISNKCNKTPDVSELASNNNILTQISMQNLSPIVLKPDKNVKDLKSLFYTWFMKKLWEWKPNNKTEYDRLRKYTKLIEYMKHFLPPNTIIKPIEDIQQWDNFLKNLSVVAEINLISFLKCKVQSKYKLNNTVFGTLERLMKISQVEYPIMSVQDLCMPPFKKNSI